MHRYALTMGIRMVCFLLMALVPLGWWTWAFAAGAIVLPYLAVVYANAGSDSTATTVESPVLQLAETAGPDPTKTVEDAPEVITVRERGDDPS
ncbi:hypothetical protein FM104_04400 [Microbacterium esteraromaticum]|uniref:DUF3099 domain-containing protein n=1 Tax=Microbacterium esteraromaticum TaxID=57043 RepID=A0A1R4IXY8_9MICO|nr:hypothetical protein FM104_04400 [Microbacterium esteraromaticum]